MAGKVAPLQPAESFEFMFLEGDLEHLRSVVSSTSQNSPKLDSSALKLRHRIGRGPFGDVWIATHHQCTEDHDHYLEVAVKIMVPMKYDHIQACLTRFDELFFKCQGLEKVCFLHGVTIHSGRICIAMRYYEGSVGDKMGRLEGGKLSLSDVLRYGIDLAQGILELHSKGVLLLNLKPCNFLLDEHDRAIIGDCGFPNLLLGLSLPSTDMAQRLGTPNYMAPEQWDPNIRGPISFETDSWGFGCSIVEMLCGIQPWHGKSPDEIYQLVTVKKEKPQIPTGLPSHLEDVLYGCFEYDLRDRPLISDILHVFRSCSDSICNIKVYDNLMAEKSSHICYTNWALTKEQLQVGDTVRSRKSRNSCKQEAMGIPEGTIVGKPDADDGFFLVRVHGIHNPLRVHCSTLERVSYGFVAGDWVRVMDSERKQSSVGILHNIDRDGRVSVGFMGKDTLWHGNYSDLQMAETYCVGQFIRLKDNVSRPKFEWPSKQGGAWATGRICQILPNGCLIVKFPGRFGFQALDNFVADPSEVEVVSFKTCEGVIKKYEHLEDFHWAVRPLVIVVGLFTALRMGLFVGKSIGITRRKKNGKAISTAGYQESREEEIVAPYYGFTCQKEEKWEGYQHCRLSRKP